MVNLLINHFLVNMSPLFESNWQTYAHITNSSLSKIYFLDFFCDIYNEKSIVISIAQKLFYILFFVMWIRWRLWMQRYCKKLRSDVLHAMMLQVKKKLFEISFMNNFEFKIDEERTGSLYSFIIRRQFLKSKFRTIVI